MRVLVFGIYGIGTEALGALLRAGVAVVGVVTKPGAEPSQEPLRALARGRELPLLAPGSPAEPDFLREVAALGPDLVVVAGYHKIIPAALLAMPRRGTLNLHLSLLPAYRGPCPWKWALARGEAETGVTVHVMTPRLDRGEIVAQRRVPILEDDTGERLFQRLCATGAEVLVDTVERLAQGPIAGRAQDEAAASYHGSPMDDDARISWGSPARTIRGLIQGMSPRPGAWTRHEGRRVRIRLATLREGTCELEAGTIVERLGESVIAATGAGLLELRDLELEEGAAPLRAGDRFEHGLTGAT